MEKKIEPCLRKRGGGRPKLMRTPGEHLCAEMQRFGFDQGALADALGVSWQSVNNIVTNQLPIS